VRQTVTDENLTFTWLQVRTGVTMVQTEGVSALMSGVSATVARGVFYGGAWLLALFPARVTCAAQRWCLLCSGSGAESVAALLAFSRAAGQA